MSTHGEVWFEKKQEVYAESSRLFHFENAVPTGIPQRMPKAEAAAYYTQKLNTVWHQLGITKKEKPMSEKTKLQKQFNSIKDNEPINITKGQLIALCEMAKADAIKAYTEQNNFNAEELFHAIKAS